MTAAKPTFTAFPKTSDGDIAEQDILVGDDIIGTITRESFATTAARSARFAELIAKVAFIVDDIARELDMSEIIMRKANAFARHEAAFSPGKYHHGDLLDILRRVAPLPRLWHRDKLDLGTRIHRRYDRMRRDARVAKERHRFELRRDRVRGHKVDFIVDELHDGPLA